MDLYKTGVAKRGVTKKRRKKSGVWKNPNLWEGCQANDISRSYVIIRGQKEVARDVKVEKTNNGWGEKI